MEPQVKPAENSNCLAVPIRSLASFNGAASKTCGKHRSSLSHTVLRLASMEPQVKPAENLIHLLASSIGSRFNGAASKTCGKLERLLFLRLRPLRFNGAASKTCGKHLPEN